MKKIERLSHSVFVRLAVFALVISIIPFVCASALMLIRTERLTEKQLTESYQWLVDEYMGNAEENWEQYQLKMNYLASNTTIQDILSSYEGGVTERGNAITKEVIKTIYPETSSEVRNCIVYTMGDRKLTYGLRVTMMTDVVVRSWEKAGWKPGDDYFVSKAFGGREIVSFIRPLEKVDERDFAAIRLGYIKLDIYVDEMFAPKGKAQRGDYQVTLYDENDTVLYSSDDGQKYDDCLVVDKRLAGTDMHVSFTFKNAAAVARDQSIQHYLYPAVAAVCVLMIVMVWLVFRRFSRRVDRLSEKFSVAGTGNLSANELIGGNDEIAMLDEQFESMLREMNRINEENEEQQRVIREAEYENLQLQINPHFLYNTLETISSIAAVNDVFQVCDLCEKLGELFRYSLGKDAGRFVMLDQELRQIRNYIFIQQARYRFEAYYYIDADAETLYIPRFLLQPIVENAILHGLAQRKEPGTLEVYAGEDGDNLIIRISDDGAGMTREQVGRLNRQLKNGGRIHRTGRSIGLWNISQRIRLSFGEKYGITVESLAGQGSEFRICLPAIRKDISRENEGVKES